MPRTHRTRHLCGGMAGGDGKARVPAVSGIHEVHWTRYSVPTPELLNLVYADANRGYTASARLNPANGEPLIYSPKFDILEVNAYMIAGLQSSAIESFFTGELPRFSLESVASDTLSKPLSAILDEARNVVGDPSRLTWPPVIVSKRTHNHLSADPLMHSPPQITQPRDLSRLDRNLELLVHELGQQCQRIFSRAAKAVVKTASVQHAWLTAEPNSRMTSLVSPLKECQIRPPVTVRERVSRGEGGVSRTLRASFNLLNMHRFSDRTFCSNTWPCAYKNLARASQGKSSVGAPNIQGTKLTFTG